MNEIELLQAILDSIEIIRVGVAIIAGASLAVMMILMFKG